MELLADIFESLPSTLRILDSNLESDRARDCILDTWEKPVLETLSLRDIGYLLSL